MAKPIAAARAVLVNSSPVNPAEMASSMIGNPIPALSAVGNPLSSTLPSGLREDPSSSKEKN